MRFTTGSLIAQMESEPLIEVTPLIRRIAATEVVELQPLGGGRNSRVFLAHCQDGRAFVAKWYYIHDGDPRDRMGTEFRAYELIWRHRIGRVPKPLGVDPSKNVAIYEYLEGTSVSSSMINQDLIGQAVDFLAALRDLRPEVLKEEISRASEACFSISEVLGSVERRLEALGSVAKTHPDLNAFLHEKLIPFRERTVAWCSLKLRQLGHNYEEELPFSLRTLSPSDFGFHNSVLQRTGRLSFVDFEYFGWDDPAKTIVDFLLHPAMSLSPTCRKYFVEKMLDCFVTDSWLSARVELVFPLFGLKWCCILLNEFVDHHRSRREFASAASIPDGEMESQQLHKAAKLLEEMDGKFGEFPY